MSRSPETKLFVIAAVTGVMLIALFAVNGVIDSRQNFRDDAVHSIESSYAGPQTIVGPVLVRPYTETFSSVETNNKGQKHTVTSTKERTATSFARELSITGNLAPSERRHGLYTVTVYEFAGHITGYVDVVDPAGTGTLKWGEPFLSLSVADVRGIVGTPAVTVNGVPETMVQGAAASDAWQPNLRIPLRGAGALGGRIRFDIRMDLAGTERLALAPSGDSNHFELSSTWPSPLFAAQFLPRTRRVGPQGFDASWEVSSLASGTQTQMTHTPAVVPDMVDVSLLTPIDPYKLSDRATKYGVLFVVLTFGGFFLFEVMKQLPIHPVQYGLVGFGLAIFFLLLISFSEHLPFGVAYTLASAACIGLLTFYLSFVLRSVTRGLTFGSMLTTLYAAMYGLLISEDNALVLGSLLLFAVLACAMIVTRKVDWYRSSGAVPLPLSPASSGPGGFGIPVPPPATAAGPPMQSLGRILD